MVESFRANPYAEFHFKQTVELARNANPFYRRWITDPENVPIIDRKTFLEHNDEILGGHESTGATSGSTGIPVRFSQSAEWHRRAAADRNRLIRQIGGRVPVAAILYRTGDPIPSHLPISSSMNDQIDFILKRRQEVGVRAVTTYPTNALNLSQAILDRGIDLSFITRFGMYGEAIEQIHLDMVAKAFPNARVWTTYTTSEFGIIAAMCPHVPEYHHIMAHRLGVEVLRDDGSPAADGERGRVVITDYFNTQSPFIRYELGDYAVRGRCPCRKLRLPAFRQIIGKTRGALLHRNGDRIVFADLSVRLRGLPGMIQYQVIQDSTEDFLVKIVADGNLDEAVDDAFAAYFGYTPETVRTEYVDSIPLGPNGKFFASICNA